MDHPWPVHMMEFGRFWLNSSNVTPARTSEKVLLRVKYLAKIKNRSDFTLVIFVGGLTYSGKYMEYMNFFQFQCRHRPPWAGYGPKKKVQSFGIITTGASFAVANGGYPRITSSETLWDFC